MFFIQDRDCEIFEQTIVIVGVGLRALEVVYQFIQLGHSVILVTPFFLSIEGGENDDINILSEFLTNYSFNVRIITKAILIDLKGRRGCFTIYLDSVTSGREIIICGSIVLVSSGKYRIESLPICYDSQVIMPITKLYFFILSERPVNKFLQVAIFAGIAEPISALAFCRLMKISLKIQLSSRIQVSIFFSEARVAIKDGEYYYRAARRAGINLVRVELNELEIDQDGYTLIWYDRILEQKLKFRPDIIAASEDIIANPFLFFKKAVFLSIYSRLLTKNILLSKYRAKRGFYILGSLVSKSVRLLQIVEASRVVLEAHELLTNDNFFTLNINTKICSNCLTCVRICPQGLFYYQDNRITYSKTGCLFCGICVEYCPAMAISLSGLSHFEMVKTLRQNMKKLSRPFLVLISCINSSYKVYEELINSGFPFSENLLHIQVPCAGRVGVHLLLSILEMGVVGVLIVACQRDSCRSLFGNKLSLIAVNYIRNNLSKSEIDLSNVRLIYISSNQCQKLSNILMDILISYY